MLPVAVLLLVVWIAVGGGVGTLIGRPKGREREGFWLGAVLGWIGWIIVAVMQPTPQAQAVHEQQVVEAALRLSSGAGKPAARSVVERRTAATHLVPVRRAAELDPQAATLAGAIEQFEREVAPQRPVTEWMFADGRYPLVVRYDGVLHLASAVEIRKVGPGADASCDVAADGTPLAAVIDRVPLDRPRPAVQARAILDGLRAVETVRSDIPVPSPAPATAPDRTADLRDRLATLDALVADGTISGDEHQRRRQAILDEV